MPLRRKLLLIILFAEIALVGLILGMRLRGAAANWIGPAHVPAASSGWAGRWIPAGSFRALTLALELAAALGAFLSARHWSIRSDLAPARSSLLSASLGRIARWITGGAAASHRHRSLAATPQPQPFQGCARAMAAAILVWLSPALILSSSGGHLDAWLAPLLIFAVFAALLDAWFICGALVAAACALNLHLLVLAPFFILWPLCANAPRAMFRCLLGFAFLITLAVAPQLATTHTTWLWVVGVAMSPILLKRTWAGDGPFAAPWIAGPVTLQLVCWPLFLPQNRAMIPAAALLLLGLTLISLCRRMSAKWFAYQIALAATAGLLVAPLIFPGSYAWVSDPLQAWSQTAPAGSLRTILQSRLGLDYAQVIFTIDLPAFRLNHDVTVGRAAAAAYAIALLLAAAITAWQTGRQGRGALVGATLPLLLAAAFTDLPAPTALALAAACSALWIAAGVGMTLIHLVLTATAAVIVAAGLIAGGPDSFPKTAKLVNATREAWPWLVLLATGIAAYGAMFAGGGRNQRGGD